MFESCNRITLICESDFKTLNESSSEFNPQDNLPNERQEKLEHAIILDDHLYPVYLVRTGTVVSLKDLGTGSISRFRITSGIDKSNGSDQVSDISASSALGATLLGMRVGEDLKWTLPLGHIRYLRICRLTEPESSIVN